MRIRFSFNKTGRLKYIGHLDLLNVWNRAIKTAGLPVSYSNGFNPHMLVSFAAPLPLGLESLSEYVDVDFEDNTPLDQMAEKINAGFPGGLAITGVYELERPYKRVAAVVERARYRFSAPVDVTQEQIDSFMAQRTIEVLKKTKRSCGVSDILPDIFSVLKDDDGVCAVLSCGSAKNLKPTLFAEAFFGFLSIDVPLYKIKITRTEIYGETASGFKPLKEIGLKIVECGDKGFMDTKSTMLPPLEIKSWSEESLSNLVAKILSLMPKPLILVDGVAGSGKTTLAAKLANILNANIVSSDDLCWGTDPIHWDGELLAGIVNPWQSGNNVAYKPSGWIKENLSGTIDIDANRALVIEGMGASRKSLRAISTYSIWVDTEPELARNRVVQRDLSNEENGGTLESVTEFANWWDSLLVPLFLEEKPWKYVDVIVSGSQSDLFSNKLMTHIPNSLTY